MVDTPIKIVTIIGARPQFIKAGTVSRLLQKEPMINEVIIHTGQHFDKNMSDIFFNEMEIPKPNYNLNINNLSHGKMTGKMLAAIEEILIKQKPNYILVFGDTNSTLAGALAAKKLHIKVIHVEAGLRSYNTQMPEEINRILTDRISNLLFCPTSKSIENLKQEGFPFNGSKEICCGDVMLDGAIYYSKTSTQKSNIINQLELANQDFLLCTIHREENTNNIEHFKNILSALDKLSESHQIICPLHPRTQKIIKSNNLSTRAKIINPIGYFDMIELLKNCQLVITDSGGLQKEAFFFKKYCVTLREETEWVELVENNVNSLAGTNYDLIVNSVNSALKNNFNFNLNPYGDGNAANIILEEIKKDFLSKN